LVASQEADTIVLIEVIRKDDSIWLKVVDALRGDVQGSIPVASCIWDAVTIGRKPEGQASYLLLLRGTEEIMCGHVNGLATISGGCIGLLPIVDGSVPKEFARRYDGISQEPIPLGQIRRDLKNAGRNR
jgi:hypothetical protein